jgi:hypothetical protein
MRCIKYDSIFKLAFSTKKLAYVTDLFKQPAERPETKPTGA